MDRSYKEKLSMLTGSGVRVGIVDSGYTPGKRNINVMRGVNLSSNGELQSDSNQLENYTDNIGHGTACAGIIFKKATQAEIYPVKIFDTELVSDTKKLLTAVKWCYENKLQVINLSLGTTDATSKKDLEEVCNLVFDNNMYIVAATSNDSQKSYPAVLPNVFGVTAGRVRGKYDFYYNDNKPIQFIARGDRQRLDWVDGKQIFMGGTSFAAPHITAIIALLLQKYPGVTYDELVEILKKYSLPEKPIFVDGQEFYNMPGMSVLQTKPRFKLSEIHQQNNIQWIKQADIFPYNKEMHSLVRYQNLLPFQISGVVDVVGKITIGKDSGEVIGAGNSGIIVQKKIEECLTEADTIILGYLDELSRIKRRDILKEMLELALQHRKNVYSLTPITEDNYPDLFPKFKEKKLHIGSPVITYTDFEKTTEAFDWRVQSRKPVIGVFGTSPQQGKFTTQLALRQELQKIGYKVGQLGTEHQSALFGFDYTFPNGYDGIHNIRIPMDMHIPLLQSVMVGIENDDPHIIIVGGQSGIIPYSFAEKSQRYTLSSLVIIFGTIPDAYILIVNNIDELDYMQDNINVLKGLGKGETILLVFSDKKKELVTRFGRSLITYTPLTEEEIQQTAKRLEDHFGIPATEIISEGGRRKMVSAVENYFAEE